MTGGTGGTVQRKDDEETECVRTDVMPVCSTARVSVCPCARVPYASILLCLYARREVSERRTQAAADDF